MKIVLLLFCLFVGCFFLGGGGSLIGDMTVVRMKLAFTLVINLSMVLEIVMDIRDVTSLVQNVS